MIAVSHPTGNTFSRALVRYLLAHDRLARFYTAFAYPDIAPARALANVPALRHLGRRGFSEVPAHLLRSHPARELGRALAPRLRLGQLTGAEDAPFSVDAVYRSLDRYVARDLPSAGAAAAYAYEDGALETFAVAESLGLRRVYDLPIAHYLVKDRILARERERLPAWAPTMGGVSGAPDSPEKLARKDAELRSADLVVVPSRFVADSLPEWVDPARVVLAPFGTPAGATGGAPAAFATSPRDYTERDPLRVLFVGGMGQRKGLADLFAAVAQLGSKRVELVVLGAPIAPLDFYREQGPAFRYEPTRPHAEVLKLMRSCDVFCLPSLAEGRALVMQEAMSQGLPLIITPNTGGADLVRAGDTGYLVPVAEPAAIAARIEWFLEHPRDLPAMRAAAAKHAAQYTWDGYASTIVAAVDGLDA